MLEFKKYSSIENSFSREFMEHVVAEMPQDLEYVVQGVSRQSAFLDARRYLQRCHRED